jgi:hypothetical protein
MHNCAIHLLNYVAGLLKMQGTALLLRDERGIRIGAHGAAVRRLSWCTACPASVWIHSRLLRACTCMTRLQACLVAVAALQMLIFSCAQRRCTLLTHCLTDNSAALVLTFAFSLWTALGGPWQRQEFDSGAMPSVSFLFNLQLLWCV